MTVEPLSTPTALEVADAKDANDADNNLREFGKCAVALRDALYQDRSLTAMEFHFMDNHFQVVEMAYLRWKRNHRDLQDGNDPVEQRTYQPVRTKGQQNHLRS
ncbi:MAG: hypothetical protein ABI980_12600 [Nitrospirota bacterium]